MKTIPVIALVVCATALSASPALAKNSSKLTYQHGVITSVDTTAHQLVIKEHKHAAQTFLWTGQTKFARGKHAVTAADLKPGEKVRVGFKSGTSPLTAQMLDIRPAWGHRHARKAG